MKIHNFRKDSMAMDKNEKEVVESRRVESTHNEQEDTDHLSDTSEAPEEEAPKKGRKKKNEAHV